MRIAFFHELHFGGARRVVYEYAKVLSKSNKVDLFYVDSDKEDIEKHFNESKLYSLDYKKYKGGSPLLKIYNDFVIPYRLQKLHKKIAKEIDSRNYDFVFVHPSQFTHAPFILKYLKTPNLYFCHEPLRTVYDPVVDLKINNLIKNLYEIISRRIKKIIDQKNIKSADLVITNCNYSKNNIKKAYCIEAEVCYLGVDPNLFKPKNFNKIYDLIFVGDTIPMEGYDTLTEIIKPFNGTLKVKVIKPNKNKYITDEELAQEYNKSKLLVVLGRFDPFSMIPWEGMSCEVPPIVVNEGGPIEAVRDNETGYIVERNPLIIKQKIDLLLSNEVLRKRIGQNGRKDILDNWTWEKSGERVIQISKKICKKSF